jgi:glutamate/tyrosine decarboxylase-like PLP-dependent enzyme
VTSVQWSRRFLGLRLFLSLGAAGWAGYAEHIERSVDLAQQLKARLLAQGWQTMNTSPLAVLCVAPPAGAGPLRSIVDRLLTSGRAWVSTAIFNEREVIRACITNGETMTHDVVELVDALTAAAHRPSTTRPLQSGT